MPFDMAKVKYLLKFFCKKWFYNLKFSSVPLIHSPVVDFLSAGPPMVGQVCEIRSHYRCWRLSAVSLIAC